MITESGTTPVVKQIKKRSPVAKHGRKFNRGGPHLDRKKEDKKHGVVQEPDLSIINVQS